MYELMEDFEEVLSRAPISISGHDPTLRMGGRINGTSSIVNAGEAEGETKSSAAGAKQQSTGHLDGDGGRKEDKAIFTAGNCLTGSCCYNNSSTESDTVRQDLPKSASKYKKQRERLLSRPTL